MVAAFLDSLDIAKKACILVGVPPILSVDEDSQKNEVISTVYDQARQGELRRNVWRFAKRKAVLRPIGASTRLINPADWSENTLYLPGSIVKHDNGQLWISLETENQGNEPGVSGVWDHYYGPMTVSLWDVDDTYYAGELVYAEGSRAGSFIVYYSLKNSNTDNPETVTAWDVDATYKLDDVVSYLDWQWRSVIPVNTGITPADAPADWASGTTYVIDDTVTGSDGFIYTSLTNDNLGNDPVEDEGDDWEISDAPYAWNRLPNKQGASSNWLPLFAGLKNVPLDYLSLALGGSRVSGLAGIFRVPSGYLRRARENPKVATPEDDHEAVGDYITSNDGVLHLTFVADITDVRQMDAMFCEGLAARIALDVVETLTQSTSKVGTLATIYSKFMSEARTVNAIEVGPEEPDEDYFITVRD